MRSDVRDALASRWPRLRVIRQLHAVPPHEVYEVRLDGQRAVCKYDSGTTGSAGVEGRVLAFVREQTSLPVPAVLAVGADYFVATWHPDAPEPAADEEPDSAWAEGAGRALATLHAETESAIDSWGPFRVEGGSDGLSVAGAEDWHAAATAYVRRRRVVLERFGHADVADAVVAFLEERPNVFDGAGSPVCCHGWATPEHLAVRDGRVACLLDFEHAIAAPAEFDYWRTVGPAFERGGNGRADLDAERLERAFRDGYESVRPLPSGVDRRRPLYELLNAVYYLESLFVQDRHGPAETAERAAWLREHAFETLDRIED